MNFTEYQNKAKETSRYPETYRVIYPAMGVSGEAGEIANKVQKLMRDKNMILEDEDRRSLALELGDVLWFISALAGDLGYDMETIAKMNIQKLADRNARNVIGGSGDTR